MQNKIILALLALFLLPQVVFADVITPLAYITLPAIPLIILAESLYLYFVLRKRLSFKNKGLKITLIVSLANLTTSLFGTFIPLYKYSAENLIWILVAYFLTVFIEWLIYLPFFRKENLTKGQLLKYSAWANLITYIPLAGFMYIMK